MYSEHTKFSCWNDLEAERTVPFETIRKFATEQGFPIMETSVEEKLTEDE